MNPRGQGSQAQFRCEPDAAHLDRTIMVDGGVANGERYGRQGGGVGKIKGVSGTCVLFAGRTNIKLSYYGGSHKISSRVPQLARGPRV